MNTHHTKHTNPTLGALPLASALAAAILKDHSIDDPGMPAPNPWALKQNAKVHHRSLNGETLTWLEKQATAEGVCTAGEMAAALRRFHKLTTEEDRRLMAEGIEQARRRAAH